MKQLEAPGRSTLTLTPHHANTCPTGRASRRSGLARAAAAVSAALALTLGGLPGCAVTSGQSSVGQYVDDATITTRVKARMAEDPTVAALRIKVETLKGEVQLSGFATSQAEKDRAGAIAAAVPDVKGVRNSIVVSTPSQ